MNRILVIDDDVAIRTAFTLALESSPYSLVTAENGEKGLELAMSEPVDLVFLDLKMPGMSGIETLRRLRAAGCQSPVYVITAFAEEFMRDLRVVAEEGVEFELVQKPLELDQINGVADAVLGARERAIDGARQ